MSMTITRYHARPLNAAEQISFDKFAAMLADAIADGVITHEELRAINAKINEIPADQELTFKQLSLVQQLVWHQIRSHTLTLEP